MNFNVLIKKIESTRFSLSFISLRLFHQYVCMIIKMYGTSQKKNEKNKLNIIVIID